MGIGELILLGVLWVRVRTLQEIAGDRSEKFGSQRQLRVRIEGWIGLLCFLGSVLAVMSVLGMRSG